MSEGKAGIARNLETKLNIRVIAIIFVISAVYYITIQMPTDFSKLDIFDIWGPLTWASAAIAAFLISKRYWGSQAFAKAYLALGIAIACSTAGETIWIYYENTGQDPYPSIADVFYFGLYPFALVHLIVNKQYFYPKFDISQKIWLIVVPSVIVLAYTFLAIDEWGFYEELPFDLFYGLIFVAGAGVLLSWAILGAAVFRHSVLGKVWLLLAASIVIQSFADVWYYYLEIFEAWNVRHITNTLWMFSWMLMTYALYKHRKVV
jgi:hypothetical protein